jgi:ribonuclease BN (tRNA processing enzyme)
MKVTIVGSGDAFATGGRAHTCIRIDSAATSAIVDFGASSISAWKSLGLDFGAVDIVLISHLHGDHFGGLPFLLLDCQFSEKRSKPLVLVGPPGLHDRLESTFDLLFPGIRNIGWSFDWQVEELLPGTAFVRNGLEIETIAVAHECGGVATGVRIDDGSRVFAYSGDTTWTDALYDLAADADLFLTECFSGDGPVPNHLDWPTLADHLAGFSARQVVVTHMSKSALSRRAEMERAGLVIAHDGQTFEI